MITTFVLPLINIPQSFEIALAGITYLLTCKWNSAFEAGWVLDFTDSNTNEPIVTNIPLITGANLLSGLEYLGFNGSLYVETDGDVFAVPTLENLGINSNVYFLTEIT